MAGPLRGPGRGRPGGWSEWFEGLEVESVGDETIPSGMLPDQSALHGVLDKERDLGLSVIAVRRLAPGQEGELR